MIDLLLNIRKPDIRGIWNILGSKWRRAAASKENTKDIESLWAINDLMASGRLNSLVNIYQKQTQLANFSVLDFLILQPEKFRKTKNIYNNEIKVFYKDINLYPGSIVKEILSPIIFTNELNGPEFLLPLITDNIYSVKQKEKTLSLIRGGSIETEIFKYKNYIFIDSKNIPFIIKNIDKNKIFYDVLLTDTVPTIGEIKIVNKFELTLNEDYIVEFFDKFIKISFKDFYVINNEGIVNNFFGLQKKLYSVNIPCVDTFEREHFLKPLGLSDSDYDLLKDKNNTWFDVQEKIYKLWRLNQRIFNFKQIYRIASILGEENITKSIIDSEIIYDIDKESNQIKTGKLKNTLYGTILSNENLPEYLRTEGLPENTPNIIFLTNGFNTFGLFFGDIIVIDNKFYKITKIINDKYFKVDRNIESGEYIRKIDLISANNISSYSANNYGFKSLFDSTLNMHNNIHIGTTRFNKDLIWGNFKWGETALYPINPLCNFDTFSVGQKLLYGDTFSKMVSIDYRENDINPYYIQKELALKNKEFTEEHVQSLLIRKTLLIDHFLSYSIFSDIIENIIDDSWTASSNVTYTKQTKTSYSLTYTTIKMSEANEKLYLQIQPSENNLLRFFIRKKTGKLKAGVTNGYTVSFNGADYFYTTDINEDNKWEMVNIFFDTNNGNHYILFENELKDTEFDIFGIQLFSNIPPFVEKMNRNKQILEKLVSQYDIETINLL